MIDRLADTDLLERIAAKDAEALQQLYDRYEKPVYAFAYRMVKDAMQAEEIVQELFFRIWNAAEHYDPAQGKWTTWMFTLTRNIAIDGLRKKENRTVKQMTEPEKLQQYADRNTNTEAEIENKLIGEEVRAALQSLNKDQQQVIEMIYFGGYTQQEVSSQQEIPLGTVKSRVRLAIKQLKQILTSGGKEEAWK
ncbi:RNA polymerase sigma24 factor [Paenibacillus swuensis]|uniref:RNA polymerase sigma24 factor n=1 Tax=Paenibacillus swuensis TaxID=1178515 RepID=A0A172TM44_9BACL|nr:sigma-70 family RNA polymerase sigma factor [Paenibacillus swuensis]ANE48125.1 RNA polymerase sigma24 factor [Paenibacillus swuensis]